MRVDEPALPPACSVHPRARISGILHDTVFIRRTDAGLGWVPQLAMLRAPFAIASIAIHHARAVVFDPVRERFVSSPPSHLLSFMCREGFTNSFMILFENRIGFRIPNKPPLPDAL